MNFPATRTAALERLQDFIAVSGKYSRDRNHVFPDHSNVSRLSAAIRHRLLTEWEVAAAPLAKYAASTIEKFTQEVYWRSYWKGWLSQRPQVWTEYSEWQGDDPQAEKIRNGNGPIGVMNVFANELRETGYLHNHARMWFAAYWVHVARLPWQLGARFFQDHLLDFDPASNTLSWRWVAGWQTPGKTYLPRRSNLEKYLHPDLLEEVGLEQLEKPTAHLPEIPGKSPISRSHLPLNATPRGEFVLWIHEEDLNPETSPLGDLKPTHILVTRNLEGKSPLQKKWLEVALGETTDRCEKHFRTSAVRAENLLSWAQTNPGKTIVALRPEVGPLHDTLSTIEQAGTDLQLLVRPEDRMLRSLATAGFFSFWEKLQTQIKNGEFPPRELF